MTDLTLLSVHPHPDDEAIACGGTLARAAAHGAVTHVVTCTGGEAGSNLAGIDLGEREIADVRIDEMAAALEELGVAGHTWLGFRDSGMAGTADNEHRDAFANADLYYAAARLARVIRRVRPHVVVSDDEHGTYGHPDHVQAHRVTERAVTLAADPWWVTEAPPWTVAKRYVHTLSRSRMYQMHTVLRGMDLPSPFGDQDVSGPDDLPFGAPDEQITTRIDVAEFLDHKQAAMRAHRSQIAEDSFFFNLPDELAGRGFGVEEFTLLHGTAAPDADGLEHDLFAGLTADGDPR